MAISSLAGKTAPKEILVDLQKLELQYHQNKPDFEDTNQRVIFGTSGHRGTPSNGTYTEAHVAAITQSICEYRKAAGISGPLFLGKDTHALSRSSERTALEVLAANGVETILERNDEVTPTPAISHAILLHNRNANGRLADGIVITPSHNPPEDGGFKYNPPHGGPAESEVTTRIQNRANEILSNQNQEVKRISFEAAMRASTTTQRDLCLQYVQDLPSIINLDAISNARIRIGVDPLGGAATRYWEPIAEKFKLDVTVVNQSIDPTFAFMPVDHDGKIRMDCSSPYAMTNLIQMKDRFQIAFGNDADCDRHGIVTPSKGLLNPNHYLAVAISYLISNRPDWRTDLVIGKTVVSSSMIDRVVSQAKRVLLEVPVGFKWFSPGLHDGSLCFGGEESAGASFLRKDGTAWCTDKDGIIMNLLAAEILAVSGKDPGEHYDELTRRFGDPKYVRIDAPATPEQKAKLQKLSPDAVKGTMLAGERIVSKLTKAPGNQASIGGLKCSTENGWFAARPSGTENIYKIYAESFKGEAHLQQIVEEAKTLVTDALA